jgi:hypothetical protein
MPVALLAGSDAFPRAAPLPEAGRYTVEEFRLTPDGFDIDVARLPHAAEGPGMVVVNAPYSRFWQAAVDGRRAEILPVNAVHMGVVVDGDARRVELQYARPTVLEALAAAF